VSFLYSIDSSLLSTLDQPVGDSITEDGLQLRFGDQSTLLETTLVSYSQTRWSLPIWEAGLGVSILAGPQRVTSSRSTLHTDPSFHAPSKKPRFLLKEINDRVLRTQLGLAGLNLKINATRLRVYQYDPSKRYDPESSTQPPAPQRRKISLSRSEPKGASQSLLRDGPPILPLPAVPPAIETGVHYVVTEVLFTLSPARGTGKGLNWRVFLEVDSGTPLLSACVRSWRLCQCL
jgi:zinc metalloprotease ZmpB